LSLVLGSFSLYFAQAHAFEREERDFLWAVAGLAAQALERARLYASEQARAQELDRQQQYYRALVEQSTDLVLLVTPEGTIRYASPSHERVLGLRVQDLAGTSVTTFVDCEDRACLGESLEAVRRVGGIMRLGEFRVRHADGTQRTLEMFANNRLADPAVGGIILNNRDVTERKRAEILLEHQAFHDALTELPNRILLNERLNHLLRNAGRRRTSFGLFLLDLDHFKEVNDTLGHWCGDLLLKEVAARLVCTMHASDTVARLGGDEFAILCPLLSVHGATTVARHMIEALAAPWSVQGYRVDIAGSIGIAVYPAHGCEASVLLAHADRAMYAAKEVGAGYALYDAALERAHRRSMLPAAGVASLDSHELG
jgi:diguanylate cyclase (GGDEF)-like protein/PAS domain S-box-containing protein